MPFFYSYYAGRGREALADQLQANDPFSLTPTQIVWRLLSTGHGPMLDRPRRRPFFECGETTEVERGAQWFLVSMNRDAEMITVQEIRETAYPGVVESGRCVPGHQPTARSGARM